MSWAGCYTLDLYCENYKLNDGIHCFQEFPHQFTDEYGGKCRKQAKKAGWKILKDGRCYCPKCKVPK